MNTYIYYFDNEPCGLIESDNWDTALIDLCEYYELDADFIVNKKGLTLSHSLTEEEIVAYELEYGIRK